MQRILPTLLLGTTMVAASGCAQDESPAFRQLVDETLQEASGRHLHGRLLRPLPPDPTRGVDLDAEPEAIIDEVADNVSSKVDCATVVELSPTSLEITFAEGCEVDDRPLSGQITIAVSRSESTTLVEQTLALLRNERVSVDGKATVTWDGETRHVESSIDLMHDERSRHVEGDWIERPLDAEQGFDAVVIVDGTRIVDGCMGTVTKLLVGLEIHADEVVPRAGQVIGSRDQGGTLTITFSEIDADSIRVDVEMSPPEDGPGEPPDMGSCGEHHGGKGPHRGRHRRGKHGPPGPFAFEVTPDGEVLGRID